MNTMGTRNIVPKLKGINTNQDALNKVWDHFVKNRHCAGYHKEREECVTYDSSRPHARCALGCMTTPKECEAYLLDRYGWSECPFLYDNVWIQEVLEGRGITIASRLQEAHDDAAMKDGPFIEHMARNLNALAEDYDLTTPGRVSLSV